MRKLTGFALAVLALSATCALAQSNASSGILFASDFNAWTLPQANTPTAGMIQWPSAAICHISSNGYSFVAVKVGRPLTIVDVDPSLTETVTPLAVTTSGGSCTVTAIMAHTHLSYSVRSGTGGLQEAIDYSIPMQGGAVVILTPAWTASGGQSGMITAATGQASTSILDERVASLCSYAWNGSAYVGDGCQAGGASLTDPSLQTFAGPLAVPQGITAPLTGNVTGNLTGNVTGNVTGTVTGHSTLDCALAGCTMTGTLNTPSLIANGPVIDPRYATYGAACNWNGTTGTDDTAAFQAAANAANAIFVASGTPVSVRVPLSCVVNGTVTYGSGVHWVGPGKIIVQNQSTPSAHATLMAQNADNVSVENVTIQVVTPCAGNNAACTAIGWQDTGGDSTAHAHVYFRHNTVINANWGIYATYSSGSGSLSDVSISDNNVSSPAGSYSNADGIHVGGRISAITIVGNRITNRGDAGIGMTSEGSGTYTVSGITVASNVLLQDRVGIDCSGCTDTGITGNFVKATIASVGNSNPAFREIYYNGYPANVHVEGNYFENPASVDGNTAKIDPVLASQVSWPSINSTFVGNTIGGSNGIFYARGNGISIADNTFLISGGGIILDYDGGDNVATANVTIGTNRWQGAGVVTFGAGCALYNGVNFNPQQALGTLTVSNVSCLGTQTVNFPGTLSLGTNSLSGSANNYLTFTSGTGSPAFGANFQDAAGNNLLTINNDGLGINVPDGPINTSFYYKMGGGSNGGLRNSAGTTVVPGTATDFMGATATIVAMAEAKSMTIGNCLKVGASGGVADAGSPCGAGGSGVTSINTTAGAFTFTGAGVSCTGTTCTFSGTGSGVTSVGLTVPSWLSVSGSPVTTSGTLGVTATTGQTANQFLATPNGSTGAVGLRAIVAADVPTLNQNTTGTAGGLTGSPSITVTACTGCTAAQYKVRTCTVGFGDGLNAVPAGTYPVNFQCRNLYGVTYTITGIQCASDNNGTSTVNASDSASNALLTGAITTTTTWAAGTQSAHTTLSTNVWTTWTIVADGTSKQIQCVMAGTI